MVTLRSPGTVVARDLILATDVTNIVGCILGTAGYGQLIRGVALDDSTNYANIFGNKDTTNGRALKVQYGDHAGTPTTLATFAKAAISLELPATIKQAALSDPAATYTSIGARASDGAPVYRAAGGSETLLSTATVLTTTGDILYASSANTMARLAIGTTHHVLTVAGGLPSWAAGSKATLTTTGDLLYASGANTLARLAVGSTNQMLSVTGGVPAWKASATSVLDATGSMLYASSANTLAKLAAGTDGKILTLVSGLPSWETAASTSVANKNRIINGDMRLHQRGAAPSDNTYGLDRWRILVAGAQAANMAQDSSDVPTGGSRNAMTLTVGSGNNNKFGIFQILEGKDIWDLRGQTVSLSFQMKATSGISDVRAAVVQWTGTEDNGGTAFPDPINVWGATATVPTYTGSWANANTPANLSPTTSWASYSVTGVSVSSSATNLAVFIWSEDTTTTQTTDILRITDVQLEKSATVTAFERRHLAAELVLAQRFYTKTFPLTTTPAQNTGSNLGALYGLVTTTGAGGAYHMVWRFPSVMRAAPTITTYSPSAASANAYNINTAATSGTATPTAIGETGVAVFHSQVAGDTATHQCVLHATAVAEL